MQKISKLTAKFLAWLIACAALFAPTYALAQVGGFNQADIVQENQGEPSAKHSIDWGFKRGVGKCVFDTATTANRTIAPHGCGLIIPKNAIVTFAAYDVLTTFTSATDAATIAIKIVAANDVVSALAISNGSNIWDAGLFETIPKVETSSTWLTTTANSEVTFTVAVEALTAGKLVLWVSWMYFGDV